MSAARRGPLPDTRGGAALSADHLAALLLVGMCVAFSWIRWSVIGELWGDAPRWIFESHRAAG